MMFISINNLKTSSTATEDLWDIQEIGWMTGSAGSG